MWVDSTLLSGIDNPVENERLSVNVLPEESESSGNPLQKEEKPSKVGLWEGMVGDILFYGFLIFLVTATVLHLTGGGAPKRIAGYSAAVVLSGSMQEEIPKDSLIVTRQVDPNFLNIGDDITYLIDPTTTVTHRIVGIIENYQDTGQRAFLTKGIMNEEQDEVPVPAVNVVGKVVFHSLMLGRSILFIRRNWPLLLFILLVVTVLSRFLMWLYRKPKAQ